MNEGLRIKNLRLNIGQAEILRGVTFDIPAGKITGLAGESGSGKTMTGMTLCGLQPDGAEIRGSITYAGRDLVGMPPKSFNALRGSDIAMVFQDPTASLHPMISVGVQLTDHLRYHEKISKTAARLRAIDTLAALNVPRPAEALKKFPHQFSGGQLQRIAIAIAIICEPKILIADEPTTALDVTVQSGILRLLRDLCDQMNLAVLLVSHDLGVMSALADRIIVMRRGEIVEEGERFDVITSPRQDYTRALIESLPNPRKVGTRKGLIHG